MKLRQLTEKEFKTFADSHPQISFHQTTEWGKLKEENGWKTHLLGLEKDNKIIAGCLLLSKMTPIKKNMFYSPRGFLIDYKNYDILKTFTKEIKKYVKKQKGIFIKIDPYISYQERDIKGNIVEGGKNNKEAFDNLIKLGYKHFGFNLMQDTLQPRWLFVTKTKDTTVEEIMKQMDAKTRQILRKNEKDCIRCREINEKELSTFKDIMQHTGDRREFIDRPLKYYQNMYKYLGKTNILKILIAELHTDELIEQLTIDINKNKDEKTDKIKQHNEHPEKMNEKKYQAKIKELENEINRLEKKLNKIKDLNAKHGNVITLGGILFLVYGNEVLSLVGGSYKDFMEFQSAYTVHFEGLKYAIDNNFERYNFYGITGNFDENNPLYGLYSFKRDFGGEVVELIGEFDLIINKPMYILYKLAFKTYRFLKNLKNNIKK